MNDLGTLAAPTTVAVEALGINLSGQIVGTSWDYPLPGDFQYRAFLYSNGTMEDLNNLTSLPAGWTLGAGHGDQQFRADRRLGQRSAMPSSSRPSSPATPTATAGWTSTT